MTTYYTKDHEYVRVEGDTGIVGITDYAQSQLGDVVFVELPEIGKAVKAGGEAAVVESVKAASDVYAPIAGKIIEVNAALSDDPGLVNREPTQGGWFFRIEPADAAEIAALMDEGAYHSFVDSLA